ncbi:Adenosine 5'-monophosphoramidase [Clydaea vesicula]|uniref:Adenosine 5'-monophosphoramidase n=1 Tax=Clydaea vesicula TaxID=447962 RepID=A0AAD5U1M3_9FUNG|nr:Adenosine 5'-monophosphoramidase [Clydaea vesicula]
MSANCIFCKIIKGDIPSFKILETSLTLAFMDTDETLSEILPISKRIAKATGAVNYNFLQNNGREAHQAVDHVHFHIIPKTKEGGLEMSWDSKKFSNNELKEFCEEIKGKL